MFLVLLLEKEGLLFLETVFFLDEKDLRSIEGVFYLFRV